MASYARCGRADLFLDEGFFLTFRSDKEYGNSGSKRPAAPTSVLMYAKVKDPHVKKSVLP